MVKSFLCHGHISYPFAFVSSHRLDILPPMWTWWLSGAVFKSADVVSTHQTVTETFVSWGLWPGIGITGEVWEAVVVVATSQLWWLWQLISGADGSFEILLWLHILETKAELMLSCHVCYQRVEQEKLEEWTVVYQLVYRSLLLDYNVVSSVGSLQCRDICKNSDRCRNRWSSNSNTSSTAVGEICLFPKLMTRSTMGFM